MKHLLYGYQYAESIELLDNKISLYASQYGKCVILGTVLDNEPNEAGGSSIEQKNTQRHW